MGFMSNQWLNKGIGLRNRRYNPVPARFTGENPTDGWSRDQGIVVEITATRSNHEIQTAHLTQAEADELARVLLPSMSASTRELILLGLLRGLSDAKLLRALALHLRKRVRLPKGL
jgi:hypothetical protein